MRVRTAVIVGLYGIASVVLNVALADDEALAPLLRRRGLHRANKLVWAQGGREKAVEFITEITYGTHDEYRWEKDMKSMSMKTGGSKTSKGSDDDDTSTGKGTSSSTGKGTRSSSGKGSSGKGSSGKGSSSSSGKGKGSKTSKGDDDDSKSKTSKGDDVDDDDDDDDMSMEMSYKYQYHRKNQRTLAKANDECFMGAICENSGGALSVCCEDDTSSVIGCSTCSGCKSDAGLPVGCCASNLHASIQLWRRQALLQRRWQLLVYGSSRRYVSHQ